MEVRNELTPCLLSGEVDTPEQVVSRKEQVSGIASEANALSNIKDKQTEARL